ncbi:MAG: 3-mercaptopyruvate sulfurtransferase [Pseudomonadota bacterium]
MTSFGPLVSTDWLAQHSNQVKIVDGSWRLPGAPPARKDYDRRHIPGAIFFDIDAICDPETDLPHMLPPGPLFAKAVGELGVSHTDTIVVYDDQGFFSAPRVWWTFRAMGHPRVAVLNGGLKKWRAEGRPVDAAPISLRAAKYKASPLTNASANAHDVRSMLNVSPVQIVDARPAERFAGKVGEPRPGLRSGAMPGATNIPASELVDDRGCLHPQNILSEVFYVKGGVNPDAPIITTCGSGVAAALLALALETLGHQGVRLYDGSWAEWGKSENDSVAFPVVTA